MNPSIQVSRNIRKIGFLILILYIFVVILMQTVEFFNLVDFSSSAINNQISAPPSLEHLCGTDRLGRDVCIRTLKGSSIALEIVFLSMFFSIIIGLPLGLISGYFGGILDKSLSLIMDTIFAIPVILLSVVMAFVLGKGILNAAFALCIVYSPQYFRVIRNQTFLIKY